jgi:superfamily II DNA or RNA helicase
MALRLDPVRLLIADDVGIGKTIEALLIARELLDHNEIKRLAVLCPPYLCDQWEKELREKFNLEAVVIRSGTIGHLERQIPASRSVYEYYPVQVLSIDWVKSDRNRHQFLQFCPEMVIVDEVHGATEASEQNQSQQQRHKLLCEIASNAKRHLILLTATPHSGIETAFRSLLGLVRPEFREWNVANLEESQRITLARHFVQRTRKDIEHDWESGDARPYTPIFPERESSDETYELSEPYRRLFDKTYAFCSEIVRTGENLEERKRRVRYWGALALLRCVMSSPAAAVAALEARMGKLPEGEEEGEFSPFIFESAGDRTDDETPNPPVEAAETTLAEGERRKLRELTQLAQGIGVQPYAPTADTKLTRCTEIIQQLLHEGFHPIIWCRYVATAEYVGKHLQQVAVNQWSVTGMELPQVVVITGRLGDDERCIKIDEIDPERPRVLVATDCLSEGINLQDKFTAVLHYDLPWNPNRLEQREGRVDRYGQTAKKVRAIRFFGRNNPVDGAVIEVLLDKAREIHRTLGTYVPVPEESESVTQAVLNALFLRAPRTETTHQLRLFEDPVVVDFHRRWDRDAERERINRTRFAQRALKPEEVRKELEATDAVLGNPEEVRSFVLNAAQRLGLPITPDHRDKRIYRVSLSPAATATLPEVIRLALPATENDPWRISFDSPTPEGAEYLGRNHRFVATLARFLLEEALTKGSHATASRCGVLRTRAVTELTTILLLRVRYLLEQPDKTPLLSEEVQVLGYTMTGKGEPRWLENGEALRLVAEAKPDANLPMPEKRELVGNALQEMGNWQAVNGEWGEGHGLQREIREHIMRRVRELEESHKRIRRAVHLRVRELTIKPQLPPDLLGLLVLQPLVGL